MDKGMRTWKIACMIGSVTYLVITLFVSGHVQAQSKAPDVVRIKIGGLLTLSGPAVAWHGAGGKIQISYFKYLNTLGGIPYREPDGSKRRFVIEHKYEDCAYSPQKAVTTYGRLRDWKAHLIIVHGSSPAGSTSTLAIRDKVPMLHVFSVHPSPMSYMDNIDKEYLMANAVSIVTLTHQNLMAYKKGVWEEKHRGHSGKAMKAAIIAFDNPSRRLYKKGVVKKLYAKSSIDLVGVELVPMASTDVTVQLNRIFREGPHVLVMDHATPGVKVILECAVRLGIRDKIGFISSYNLLRELLAIPELFDGVYNPWISSMYYTDDRSPEAGICAGRYLQDDPGYWEYRVDHAIQVQHVLMVGIEAVKRCLEEYGYEGFSRSRLRNTMFNLTDVDTGLCLRFSIDPKFPITQPYSALYRLDAKNKIYHQVGPIVAPGPSPFYPRWNPRENKEVMSNYYQWP
ncbi:MAG: ABC transporter substrate-binding protein [Desulfatiglans sp.]|nr:ABC transporter substrate-binding protein [Desulfatiglans sp.]